MTLKLHIMIIVTKMSMVINIITVLLKCVGNVQKVLIHTLKSFHQVLCKKPTNCKQNKMVG